MNDNKVIYRQRYEHAPDRTSHQYTRMKIYENLRSVLLGGKTMGSSRARDNVRIAGHVMTLPSVRARAIVGAYSLVTHDVEPCTIVYGIPARKAEDKQGLLREEILSQFK